MRRWRSTATPRPRGRPRSRPCRSGWCSTWAACANLAGCACAGSAACMPRATASRWRTRPWPGARCGGWRRATAATTGSPCPNRRRATSLSILPMDRDAASPWARSRCSRWRSRPRRTTSSPRSPDTRVAACTRAASAESRPTGPCWGWMAAPSRGCWARTVRWKWRAAASASNPSCWWTGRWPPGTTWPRASRCAMATCRSPRSTGRARTCSWTSPPSPTASRRARGWWRATACPIPAAVPATTPWRWRSARSRSIRPASSSTPAAA